jgi:hypothetical protein
MKLTTMQRNLVEGCHIVNMYLSENNIEDMAASVDTLLKLTYRHEALNSNLVVLQTEKTFMDHKANSYFLNSAQNRLSMYAEFKHHVGKMLKSRNDQGFVNDLVNAKNSFTVKTKRIDGLLNRIIHLSVQSVLSSNDKNHCKIDQLFIALRAACADNESPNHMLN